MSGVLLTQPLASPGGFHQRKTVDNITTVTTVDSIASHAAEWTVHCHEVSSPTNAETVKVYAMHNETTVDYAIASVLRTGDPITGLTYTVTLSGTDTLDLKVESTVAVDVIMRRNFVL